MSKYKFYRATKIDKLDAHYNLIFGERSSGKTYAIKEKIIRNFFKTGEQGGIIRRWDEDIKGKRGAVMFSDQNELIKRLSNGEYTQMIYRSRSWYLGRYNPDTGKVDTNEKPVCFGFGLNAMEHDKSTSYPDITTIMFDEFLTRGSYLVDEFVVFMNVISTIVRHRKNVKVYMLGNTVNKYCPYFAEMGLNNVKNMKQGDIDLYKYGESGLRVAVEYTGNLNSDKKDSNVYFAFDNPKLQMVTHGNWEIDIYPHLPMRYTPKNIIFKFFVKFNGDIVQCDIVKNGFEVIGNNKIERDTPIFIYCHAKTTELQNPKKDYVYSNKTNYLPNWHKGIMKPHDKIGDKIRQLFLKDNVFYQTNEIGEIINNYIKNVG